MSLIAGLAAAQVGTDLVNTGVNAYYSQKNLEAQRKNLAWQKSVQREAWAREDNATQRRVADLKAAGLSPVLAAGSAAGAGPVVSTQAPRADPVQLPDTATKVMALLRGNQEIAQTQSQIDLNKKQIEKVEAETQGRKIENLKQARDFKINVESGLPSDATPFVKGARDVASVVKQAWSNQDANFKSARKRLTGSTVGKTKQDANVKSAWELLTGSTVGKVKTK